LEAERQDVTEQAVFAVDRLAGMADSAISDLLDAAFGPDRHMRTAYRIRRGMAWLTDLSFAARDEAGRLIGVLQSWPVALADAQGLEAPLVMVGPVAVRPELQMGGIGRSLMDTLVARVDALTEPAQRPLVMIGDPEYYGRFWGFSADATSGWAVPGPVERQRLLARVPAGLRLPAHGALGPRGSRPIA
jgi:predicted N-acetyltransferase YhbS